MFRRLALPILLTAATATCGCSSLSGWSENLSPLGRKYVRADAQNPAVEVACIWQPGEGRNDNGIPARGFAGQMFFFTGRDSEPALVDGTMRVYLFADRGTPEERAKPLRQFDFGPEAWAMHATKTSLGPGYSVFVPYPLQEPYQVRCQLRARFTPREGPVVWSEAVTMTLEGPLRPEADRAGDRDGISPTVSDYRVTRAQIPASDLQGDADAQPRRMRVQTFPLGGIQQASYQAAASAIDGAARPLDADAIEQRLDRILHERSKEPKREHPLRSGRGMDSDQGSRVSPEPERDVSAEPARPRSGPSPERAVADATDGDGDARYPGKRLKLAGRQTFAHGHHPLMTSRSPRRTDLAPLPEEPVAVDATPVEYGPTHPLAR